MTDPARWPQRLRDEAADLAAKYEKLEAFLATPPTLPAQQVLTLKFQLQIMGTYLAILQLRIEELENAA